MFRSHAVSGRSPRRAPPRTQVQPRRPARLLRGHARTWDRAPGPKGSRALLPHVGGRCRGLGRPAPSAGRRCVVRRHPNAPPLARVHERAWTDTRRSTGLHTRSSNGTNGRRVVQLPVFWRGHDEGTLEATSDCPEQRNSPDPECCMGCPPVGNDTHRRSCYLRRQTRPGRGVMSQADA